jgi:hypothetical protein
MPARQISCATAKLRQLVMLQAGEDGGRRQDLDLGRGQLDSQGQAVQVNADAGHRDGVAGRQGKVGRDRPGAVHE